MSAADLIDSLPIDEKSQPNKQLANVLFKEENSKTLDNVFNELKDGVIISILFVIFSSEQIDGMILKIIPQTRENYFYLTGVKCLLIIFLFYILKNFHLSRKE